MGKLPFKYQHGKVFNAICFFSSAIIAFFLASTLGKFAVSLSGNQSIKGYIILPIFFLSFFVIYALVDQLLYDLTNFLYFLTVLKVSVTFSESKNYSKLLLPADKDDWSKISEILYLPVESRKQYLEQLKLSAIRE